MPEPPTAVVQFAIEHCLPWLLLGFYHRSTASSTTVHALVGRTFGGTTAVADSATARCCLHGPRDHLQHRKVAELAVPSFTPG